MQLDSVCIDQSSDMERTTQVKKMGDIYSLAVNVLVWMGEETELSRYAMKHIKRFGLLRKAFTVHVYASSIDFITQSMFEFSALAHLIVQANQIHSYSLRRHGRSH
jgi:hypothetical protein